MDKIVFTREIYLKGRSTNGGYSGAQQSLFNPNYLQAKPGWFKSNIGKSFPKALIDKFLSLKDAHLKNKKTTHVVNTQSHIIEDYPITAHHGALPTISGWYMVRTPQNEFQAYCKVKNGVPMWLLHSDVIVLEWRNLA